MKIHKRAAVLQLASTAVSHPFLNRYTSLPIALDMLSNSHITLLSPDTWEDRNDAYYLEQYGIRSKLGSVLAACFSTCRETFHHWKVFSNGSAGVCIEFNTNKLLKAFPAKDGFVTGNVCYRLLRDVKDKSRCFASGLS